MQATTIQNEALSNARNNASISNYPAIFDGFMDKGIAETDIEPRVNVFTFHAWKALGRQVRKGEHGIRIVTWITCRARKENQEDDQSDTYRRPKATTVFHITQTDTI